MSSKCLSACALAFAGGRQRYLLKGASLGFHKGAFPGVQEGEFDSAQREIFRAAGFDDRFIDTALSTAHEDMWIPAEEVLLAAGVITGVTDGTKFAFSGIGADFNKQQMATALADALPVFEGMRSRFPKKYDEIIDEYYDNLLKGRTQAETIENIRAKLLPFILTLLQIADDDVLTDYNVLLIDQYVALNARNTTKCYLYASGARPIINITADMPEEINKREQKILEQAVRTATKRANVDKNFVESLWEKVGVRLVESGFTLSDFELIASTNVETSNHQLYCTNITMILREIGRLPRSETAILMRDILAEK